MLNFKDDEKLIMQLKNTFSFVNELSPEQMKLFLNHAVLDVKEAGAVLIDKIGKCPGLALILTGELRVSKISEDGREVTLYRIGKGKVCPLSAVCMLGNFYVYPAKVVATVETKIIWVSQEFANKSMVECEPFWRYVFKCMASRLFEAMEVVDSIAFVPLRKRLAQLLLTNSNSGKHSIYTTHEALARELGTAREVVSRELKSLERAGIVKLARGRLIIENIGELEHITASPL